MTILLIKHVLSSFLLVVYGHSTSNSTKTEASNVVKNAAPGVSLKAAGANVDNPVTTAQLFSGWSPITVSLPQTSFRDLELAFGNETSAENVTSAYVEELLNRNDTKAFLNGIKNEVQREVITEQLRQCPYSELCTFSFNLSLPAGNVSACANCSCSNEYSSIFTMCPDILAF